MLLSELRDRLAQGSITQEGLDGTAGKAELTAKHL
jgi:hypothetical protein